MKIRLYLEIMLTLLALSMLALTYDVQPVGATGTIYIRAYGSIDPPTTPISTIDGITYTFTDNIYDSIVIERSNIIVDGNGFTLQGPGSGNGFTLQYLPPDTYPQNAMIKNTNINSFTNGIYMDGYACSCVVYRNNITSTTGIYVHNGRVRISENNINKGDTGIDLSGPELWDSYIEKNNITENEYEAIRVHMDCYDVTISGNNISANGQGISTQKSLVTISGNLIANNNGDGIRSGSGDTEISQNTVVGNGGNGISLIDSWSDITGNSISNNQQAAIHCVFNSNKFVGNTITGNGYGVWVDTCADIRIYHNNFVDNTRQVYDYAWDHPGIVPSVNVWDDGFPSAGNYWSDYAGVDLNNGANQDIQGGDGIGDTPYIIDANNRDNYPLMEPLVPPWVHPIISMAINPLTQLSLPGEWKTYMITVENTLNFEQTIILMGPEYSGGRWPYCDWGITQLGEYSTELTLGAGETKQVAINMRVDVLYPSTQPSYNDFTVRAFTSLCEYQYPPIASVSAEIVVAREAVPTATGSGTAYFTSDSGIIADLTAVDESTLPAEGKPSGVTFPHGLFSFTIQGLTPGQAVTLYIQMPSPVPIGSQYWKYQSGIGWFSLLIGSDDGDNEITITLTDGGIGDSDQTVNGVIVDPGGPAPILPDLASPTTTLAIGDPKYVDPSDNIFVTSNTPFTLLATDNAEGSGVAATGYQIRNATYDSGWTLSAPPTEFYFSGLTDGAYIIDYNSIDNAGNVEAIHAVAVTLDNSDPSIVVENPPAGWALQDGVTFIALSTDLCGTHSLDFSIREVNDGQGIPVGFEDIPATYNVATGKWTLFFNTLQLADGYYIVVITAGDNLGHAASLTVPYSIRNWAVLELLPATENNKAGRTMPVKFALRVAASVDTNQPFVYNEDLAIKIYATNNPSNILQTSTYGDNARDYRINALSEKYITNFQTLKAPMQYRVSIYRGAFLIDYFFFATVR